MEETHIYTVAPKIPIRGLVKGKVIIKPTNLNLTKDEVKMCLQHGPVYRKFYPNDSERVTPSNLDRLHRAEHLTEEQYKALLKNEDSEEETEVEEVVDEAPVEEEVVEESETEEVEEVSEEEELKKEEEEQLSTESEDEEITDDTVSEQIEEEVHEAMDEVIAEEEPLEEAAPVPKKKKTTSKKKKAHKTENTSEEVSE